MLLKASARPVATGGNWIRVLGMFEVMWDVSSLELRFLLADHHAFSPLDQHVLAMAGLWVAMIKVLLTERG